VSGLEALGVERETGFLGVAARSSLQVTEQSQADLQKADLNDLPAWAGRAEGYRLALEAGLALVGGRNPDLPSGSNPSPVSSPSQ